MSLMRGGESFTWRDARQEIGTAHKSAKTEKNRVMCLPVYKCYAGAVERQDVSRLRTRKNFVRRGVKTTTYCSLTKRSRVEQTVT
jgi:hypothetical protein